jgi:hypothetical protein
MARLFAVNTIGPALTAKHTLPNCPEHPARGLRGSLHVLVRLETNRGYRASKAALNMLIANFAIECGARTLWQSLWRCIRDGATSLSEPFQAGVAADNFHRKHRPPICSM